MGFRELRVVNEDRVNPGAGFPTHSHRHMEIITEAQRDDIRMLAEHLSGVISKLGDR